MSISEIGLEAISKTTSITILISAKDPLVELSNKINWTEVYRIGEKDLKCTEKGFWWVGRPILVRTHFGIYFLQTLNKWTDRQTEEYITATPKYQVFCGKSVIQNWKIPDHTKIEEFRNRFSVATHKSLGDYFLKLAVSMGYGDATWMDLDSTVQEANMAYPSDANILKKLAITTKKALDHLKDRGIKGFKSIDIDLKGICKKAQEYFFLSKNKAKKIKQDIFKNYFDKTKHELSEAIKAIENLPPKVKITLPWNITSSVEIIQTKAWRYLLDVAHFVRTHQMKKGKILCLNLSAVACITKGKVDKAREFGRQIQIGRIGGNFLIPLSTDVKMEDKQSIGPMVANHALIFGQGCLEGLGTDKGYFSQDNITKSAAMGINTDGVQRPAPCKLKPPEHVAQPLRDRRAGIEPLIGHLKSFGLRKSKMKSDSATHAAVYRCTMGFNLHQILRNMTGQVRVA